MRILDSIGRSLAAGGLILNLCPCPVNASVARAPSFETQALASEALLAKWRLLSPRTAAMLDRAASALQSNQSPLADSESAALDDLRGMDHDLGNVISVLNGHLSVLQHAEDKDGYKQQLAEFSAIVSNMLLLLEKTTSWSTKFDHSVQIRKHRKLAKEADQIHRAFLKQVQSLEAYLRTHPDFASRTRKHDQMLEIDDSLEAGVRRVRLIVTRDPEIRQIEVVGWAREIFSPEKWVIVEGEPIHARLDEAALYRILLNMIKNAREAQASKVRLLITNGESNKVTIKVSDDGQGILSEDLPKVRNALNPSAEEQPADKKTERFSTKKGKNKLLRGMGMRIIHRELSRLNGEIVVDSLALKEFESIQLHHSVQVTFDEKQLSIVREFYAEIDGYLQQILKDCQNLLRSFLPLPSEQTEMQDWYRDHNPIQRAWFVLKSQGRDEEAQDLTGHPAAHLTGTIANGLTMSIGLLQEERLEAEDIPLIFETLKYVQDEAEKARRFLYRVSLNLPTERGTTFFIHLSSETEPARKRQPSDSSA
jgi:signal transduction histidine kinase